MYLPAHFSEPRLNVLHDFIEAHPIGTMFTHGRAEHLPFLMERAEVGFGTLSAHVARANPVWQEVDDGDEVLTVFQGGDAYISPNWYPGKQEHHRVVPTWNYTVVHAHGEVRFHHDEKYLRGIVGKLTRWHEASQAPSWKMGDAPKDYIDQMLKAIVGVEIRITRLESKFKLSQNKDGRDIEVIAKHLSERESPVGSAMLRTPSGL